MAKPDTPNFSIGGRIVLGLIAIVVILSLLQTLGVFWAQANVLRIFSNAITSKNPPPFRYSRRREASAAVSPNLGELTEVEL